MSVKVIVIYQPWFIQSRVITKRPLLFTVLTADRPQTIAHPKGELWSVCCSNYCICGLLSSLPVYPVTLDVIYNGRDTLRWRHNGLDSVSNHQPRECLLSRLFGRRSKKTSKLRVTGLCAGNSPGPVNSPHKGPVTRKMLPFDDVIMI